MTSSIQKRVARGVALLDERVPGWEKRIDLKELKMQDCFQCMLGQLYGDFGYGIFRLKLKDLETDIDHGFNLDIDSIEADDFQLLQQEWTRVIKQRRGE